MGYLNGGSELSERSSRELCGDKDRPCEHWSFVGRPPRVRKPSAHGVYPHPTSAPYFRKCKQPPMSRTEAGGHYSFLTFLSHQLYHPGADPLLCTPASHLESSSRLLPKHAPSSRPEFHRNQVNLLKNLLGSRALQVKVQNLYQARLTSRHPFLTSFQPLRTSSPGGAMLSGCWRDRAARERHSHHLLSPNTLSFPSTPPACQTGSKWGTLQIST